MTAPAQKKRLGRGLAALIGDDLSEDGAVEAARALRVLPLDAIRQNPNNPRRHFDEVQLAELAASIREKGLLQPIVVRLADDGAHEIVAGERRWRAAQVAGLHEVPAVVREFSDAEALEIAIIENVQRTDLNPVEEADGYQQLLDSFGYNQEELAGIIGKSRSHITNTLRLRKLPPKLMALLREGRISAGHARALLTADNPEALAQRIVDFGLSVRQTEELARKPGAEKRPRKGSGGPVKDADTLALERDLANALGLDVDVMHSAATGGRVTIRYRSLEQLDDICRRLLSLRGK